MKIQKEEKGIYVITLKSGNQLRLNKRGGSHWHLMPWPEAYFDIHNEIGWDEMVADTEAELAWICGAQGRGTKTWHWWKTKRECLEVLKRGESWSETQEPEYWDWHTLCDHRAETISGQIEISRISLEGTCTLEQVTSLPVELVSCAA